MLEGSDGSRKRAREDATEATMHVTITSAEGDAVSQLAIEPQQTIAVIAAQLQQQVLYGAQS